MNSPKDNKKQRNNRPELLSTRRQLRQAGEAAEAVLWTAIKGRSINGFKFRRQFSIGPYILDFYCPETKLGIELDGAGHQTLDGAKYDDARTSYLLREQGIHIIRFENRDLYYNLEGVIKEIEKELNKRKRTPQSLRTAPLIQGSNKAQ